MTNTSHVELRSVLEFAEDEEPQVRFDEASRHLILIKHRELVAIPVRPLPHAGGSDAAASQPTIQCDSQGKVEQASVSLCQRYVAVQRSHVELEFLDLQRSSCSAQRQPSDGSGAWFRHDCAGGGTRARWRILSFHWTGAPVADFVVVTTAGVEFYSFSAEKRALKLVKHLAQPVAWAMYSHEMRLLLLASGSQDNVIRAFQIQPQSILRVPKFEVQLAPMQAAPIIAGQQKPRRSLQPANLTMAELNNMIFCVHVESELQEIHLYQLFKDLVVRTHTLRLYASQVAVSVCDNLLLVHAYDSKVVLLFDLKINPQSPITAPLPLSASPGFSPPYSDSWRVHAPHFIIDPQAGRVGQLSLNLPAIARSSIDKYCLLQFLLCRADAQPVILGVLGTALADMEPLADLARMFALVNTPEAQAVMERGGDPTHVLSGPDAGGAQEGDATATGLAEARHRQQDPVHAPIGPNSDMPSSAVPGDAPPAPSHPPSLLEGAPPASMSVPAASLAMGRQCASPRTSQPAASEPAAEGDTSLPTSPHAHTPLCAYDAPETAPQATNVQPGGTKPGRSMASGNLVAAVFRPAIAALRHDTQCGRRRHLLAAISLYLLSQMQSGQSPDPELGSLLLSLLVEQRSFSQLHQLLQAQAIPDSLGLAQQLLGLEPLYPPAAELGMDMLRRLGPPAHGLLVDHLVLTGDVLAACRAIRHLRLLAYPPRPLLEAAVARRDPTVFPTVYAFLALRNRSCRGSTVFLPEEDCDEFTARYNEQLRGVRVP